MKIIIFIVFFALAPSLLMAQAAGGIITRPTQKKQSNIENPTQKKSTDINKKREKQSSIGTPLQKKSINIKKRNQILKNIVSNMVFIDGGTFAMGKTQEQDGLEWGENRLPAHNVTLNSFYIAKYEVTQEEWESILGFNPSENKGNNRPVECVSWEDCQMFIETINRLTGRTFRFPTEAEWEYAARGGENSKKTKFAGSNTCEDVAWNCFSSKDSRTSNVGMKLPNELGLFDMSGNVREWCQDWYGEYPKGSQTNPRGPKNGEEKVCRGGSWLYGQIECLVSYRVKYEPNCRNSNIGLRLAESVSDKIIK